MRNRLKTLLLWSWSTTQSVDFETYQPMKLIIWLWNPGSQYTTTRHNVWFLVVDELISHFDGTDLLFNKKFNAQVSSGMIGKRQILYAKPQTFMNKSWSAVQSLINFYKLDKEDILIIHDDIDHMFWKIKLKYSGSHGGHNWIRDIIDRVWSQKFRRLKLWVGRPSNQKMVTDYVLWQMKEDELAYWSEHRKDIYEQVQQWLKNVG